MRILILLFILTLSSCGLFKKSHKQVLDVRKSAQVEVKEEVKEVISKDRETITQTDQNSGHVTEIEADEVIIKADGTVQAKGSVIAKTAGKTNIIEVKKEIESENVERGVKQVEKSVSNERVKDIDKKSEPMQVNWTALILFTCIIAILIIIIKKKLK